MSRYLLTIVLTFIGLNAPWRLSGVFVETMMMTPGWEQLPNTNLHYWDAKNLESRLRSMGWTVTYEPNLQLSGEQAYGLTDKETRTIMVSADLSWDARWMVLAHEGGHALASPWLTHNQAEAFAGSVAALVTHPKEHARYLAKLRADALMTMIVEWRAIYRAAATLEGR